ncbi:MAG: hypothetical protein ACLFP1_08205 [Candidatus Goldiibacteriota bacterium]
MRKIIITALLLAVPVLGAAAEIAPGAFIDIGLSRPSGMGGAFAAVSDDSNAVFHNPAGIALAKKADISFMHLKYKWIIPYNYLVGIMPMGERGFGAGLSISGDEIFSEQKIILSYAEKLDRFVPLAKNLAVGVNMKILSAGFGTDYEAGGGDRITGSAFGLGFDLGAIWKFDENFTAAALLKDGFSYVRWSTQHEDYDEGVPLTSYLGLAYSTEEFILSAELEDMDLLKIGIEMRFFTYIDLRAGLTQTLDSESFMEYTLGLGIRRINFGEDDKFAVSFDVAQVFERLDSTLKVQAGFQFR